MSECKLHVENLRKVYPGTVALKDFTAGFEGGKVHAVIGKNGSGKSTLIKIISGAVSPSAGTVSVDGNKVTFETPLDAFTKGIATVYQEMSLVKELSIAENIFLGRLPQTKGRLKKIDWKETHARAEMLLKDMGVNLPVTKKVRSLSVGQQQVIEIAKAMSFNPSVLMLDEPTSALAAHEVKNLFTLIKRLKAKGVAILYISHRLQELPEVADTVTVIRDGDSIGRLPIEEATSAKIVHMMFGETEQQERPADLMVAEQVILDVQNLTRHPVFHDVSFQIRKGEVLGIAGMLGAGRTELLRAVFGADPYDSGEIIFNGRTVPRPNPSLMKEYGMGLTPENRKEEGLVQLMSVGNNLCMAAWDRMGHGGHVRKSMEQPYIDRQVEKLHIKVSHTNRPVSSLSGGNQQKVVVGNWLNTNPQLMMFDEPSRGIDVQAKQQIFQIMWSLSREGISSLFVSTELEELLEVCHRILIMKHGRIVGETYPESTSLEQLYELCMEA